MTKKVAVIGAGFGGMSAAAYLARDGYDVTVYEKNDQPGGRALVVKNNGFTFDLGPSWCMMPDVFDEFFADFGKKTSDYYTLKPLSPSYRVFDNLGNPIDVHHAAQTQATFERIHKGDGVGLERLLKKTKAEYKKVRDDLLLKDWLSVRQALDPNALQFLLNPSMMTSYDRRVSRFVKDVRLKRILEFMTVFMGGSPNNIPGMYTLLSHVDMGLKIWYPMGGFGAVARGFEQLAVSQGATFTYKTAVEHIATSGLVTTLTLSDGKKVDFDIVVANADYHHVETQLLSVADRTYDEAFWQRKTLSPSGLVVCLGVAKKLPKLLHHNLFFDTDWDAHFNSVFTKKQWSKTPLMYVCAPSKSDSSVAPKGQENLFILAPQANGAQPSGQIINRTVDSIISRLEAITGSFKNDIVTQDVRAQRYFEATFNAYKGNAFGLAHTLNQSALFRPPIASKKLSSLYYVGQYTNPGTGVPMVVLSGKLVAQAIRKRSGTL